MKYAYIEGGVVCHIIPEFEAPFLNPPIPIEHRYAPDFLAQCVSVEDDANVNAGDVYDLDNGTFSAPPELEPTPLTDPPQPQAPTQEERITALEAQNALLSDTIDILFTTILPGLIDE